METKNLFDKMKEIGENRGFVVRLDDEFCGMRSIYFSHPNGYWGGAETVLIVSYHVKDKSVLVDWTCVDNVLENYSIFREAVDEKMKWHYIQLFVH